MLRRVKRPSKLQLKEAFKKGYKKALKESQRYAEDMWGETIMYPVRIYLPKNWHPGNMELTIDPLFIEPSKQRELEVSVKSMQTKTPISLSGEEGDYATMLQLYKVKPHTTVYCAFEIDEIVSYKYSREKDKVNGLNCHIAKMPGVTPVTDGVILSPEYVKDETSGSLRV